MPKISERIKQVTENINSVCEKTGRNPSEIKLVVVTKSADISDIEQVIRLGLTDLGENRAQQLKKVAVQVEEFLNQQKDDQKMPKAVSWHMIGHLQRNKVRQILPIVSLVHSVDTLRLAEEISSTASKLNITAQILMQVNSSMEPQKYGVPIAAATHLAEQIETLPNLKLVGLMTMAPLTHNENVIRDCFVRTRELFIEMKGEKIVGPHFTELSMGMSSDYQIAIQEGATILRIGSAIFAR